jgi:DNA (cytosine-5)-methyltransferase 1
VNGMKPTAIDLFCGAGGFSVGLERAGFEVICAADSWNRAVGTYRRNFAHPCLQVDLSKTNAQMLRSLAGAGDRAVDLVVGGPPCQGFSIQRIGVDHDIRNNLVVEFVRLVEELNPRMFLMENVPGLIGRRGRPLVESLLNRLSTFGYETDVRVINAADYGIPQVRKRVIVMGWRRGTVHPFSLPAPTHDSTNRATVADAIGDLSSPSRIVNDFDDPLHKQTKLSALNRERLTHIPPGGGMEHLPVHLRVDCHKAGSERIGHRYVYGRLAADRPAATITARFDSFTRGRFAHPSEDRNITLREGARLQTFEDSFRFEGNQEEIAALIGNAVPPALAGILAGAILNHLTRPEDPTRSGRPLGDTRVQLGLFELETARK